MDVGSTSSETSDDELIDSKLDPHRSRSSQKADNGIVQCIVSYLFYDIFDLMLQTFWYGCNLTLVYVAT